MYANEGAGGYLSRLISSKKIRGIEHELPRVPLSSRRTVPQLADQLSKGADGPLHLRGAFAEVEAAKLGSPAA